MITAGEIGVSLHPKKTKILSNVCRRFGRQAAQSVDIRGLNVAVLPISGSVKYLGRLVSFQDAMQTEIDHRIKLAWAKFMQHRQELTHNI